MISENFTGIGSLGSAYDARRHYWFIVWGIWMKLRIRYPERTRAFATLLSGNADKQECKNFFLSLLNYYDVAENSDLQLIEMLSTRLSLSKKEEMTILSLNGLLDKMPTPTYTNIPIPVLPNAYDYDKKISLLVDACLITVTVKNAQELQGMDNYLYFCAKGLNISEDEKLKIYQAVLKIYDSINPYSDYELFVNQVKKIDIGKIMSWLCKQCETVNPDDVLECEVCGERRFRYDHLAWAGACRGNSSKSYKKYIESYPDGIHIEEANRRYSICLKEEKADVAAWQSAKSANSSQAYSNYIRSFPQGRYLQQAKDAQQVCLEQEAWAKNNRTIQSLTYFIQKYPNGRYATQARNLLSNLKKKKETEEEENRIWKRACEKNNKKAFEKYLNAYPKGKYVSNARTKISEFKHKHKGRVWWIIAVVIIIVAVAFSVKTLHNSTIPIDSKTPFINSPSIIKHSLTVPEIKKMEDNTLKMLEALESVLPSDRNPNMINKVRENLSKLKGNSSKYDELNKRFQKINR